MTRAEAIALLGLPPDASRAAVDRRFRELAKRHHPDAVPGDPDAAARFARLAAARDRLRDPTPDPSPIPDPSRPPAHPPSKTAAPRRTPPGRTTAATLRVSPGILVGGGETEIEVYTPCPACGGTGWRKVRLLFNLPLPCPACEGRGETKRRLLLTFPKGVPPGILVETPVGPFSILPDLPEGVSLDGADLVAERTLKPGAFRRGTRITAETPDGRIRIRIPPGTSPGTVLRIRGRGLPDGRGGRGDLRLRLQDIP